MADTMNSQTLIELLYGKGAHASPITVVQGIPVQLASHTPPDHSYSIFQIVGHMNYWMDYELQRIQGGTPYYPAHAAESWASAATPSESEWRQVIAHFSASVDQLAAFARAGSEFLSRAVNPEPNQPAYSVLDVLWQTAIHNSYHVGQIVLLRRVLHTWPAEAGDSW